jgi:hypothetical protein
MNDKKSAIQQLVEHLDGPVATAKALDDQIAYQQVQVWVSRGWGAPKYFEQLMKLAPKGMTISDLFADMKMDSAA